jgi:hypothetical protein
MGLAMCHIHQKLLGHIQASVYYRDPKTIKQKHDESLQCIKIINVFHDGVIDIKTVEEIAMKKQKMVANLLAVADVCIEASKARAQLLESHSKGPSEKKQDDWEVNTIDHGGHRDRRDCGYRGKKSSKQKEKRLFKHPADTEKWCDIHRTTWHDLE